MKASLPFSIREINPTVKEEILLVAERMRQTLIEVMGQEKGSTFYTIEWLIDRVYWHLSHERIAKVMIVENNKSEIIGHAIARIEYDENKKKFGFFSTIFLLPEFRGQGIASEIIDFVENWLFSFDIYKIIYNTAANHFALINLFQKHDYIITESEGEMVRLTKVRSH